MPDDVDIRAELGPWRRFWARQLDGLVALVALVVAAAMVDPSAVVAEDAELAFGVAALLLWIPVEALLLASWGATPGKALVNLHVAGADGSPLGLRAAFSRSLRAWFFGMAGGLPLVGLLAASSAHQRLIATRSTSWDAELGLRVRAEPMTRARATLALACGAVLLIALGVLQAFASFRSGTSPSGIGAVP